MNSFITHSVFFKLRYHPGSEEEKEFLDSCRRVLSPIPGVESFRVLKQNSTKNNFDFGLSMVFKSRSEYEGYNRHPDHVAFVRDTWVPNVVEFLEIDYTDMQQML